MNSKRTLIRNLADILIHDNYARIVKAEYQYKDKTVPSKDILDGNLVYESIASIEESIFSDAIDWTYENVSEISDTEDFIVYGDFHDSIVGTVVVMHLLVEDGNTVEEVEQILNKTIFSRNVKK